MRLRGYCLAGLLLPACVTVGNAVVLAYYGFDTNGFPTTTAAGVWASELVGLNGVWDIDDVNPDHLHVETSDSEPTTTLRIELRAENPGEALDLTSIVFEQYAASGGREATYALHTSVDELWAAVDTDTDKNNTIASPSSRPGFMA